MSKINRSFFQRDVLEVAPELIGKQLVIASKNTLKKYTICEIEAYRGAEDIACHASKGRTKRTEIMFAEGGAIYVYLIYGMYWMLNFVTSIKDDPQAILIRGITGFNGPGKLTKELQIDRSYYGEYLDDSKRIWIEDNGIQLNVQTTPRIGIDYAGEPWISKPWRWVATEKEI